MTSYWRQIAFQVIGDAYADACKNGIPDSQILACIDAAYPFGQRANYPYKCWLMERRAFQIRMKWIKPTATKKQQDRAAERSGQLASLGGYRVVK